MFEVPIRAGTVMLAAVALAATTLTLPASEIGGGDSSPPGSGLMLVGAAGPASDAGSRDQRLVNKLTAYQNSNAIDESNSIAALT